MNNPKKKKGTHNYPLLPSPDKLIGKQFHVQVTSSQANSQMIGTPLPAIPDDQFMAKANLTAPVPRYNMDYTAICPHPFNPKFDIFVDTGSIHVARLIASLSAQGSILYHGG